MPEVTHKILRPYLPVLNFKGRYIDLWGGRGRGGSYFLSDYAFALLTGKPYFRGYMVRQTFGDVRDSLWLDIKDRIEGSDIENRNFRILENEMLIVHIPTSNTLKAKGVKAEGSRTAKLKSLAGATHVFIEEADEIGEEDFDQLDVSIRTDRIRTVQIIRVFNPPAKKHWIWRDYQLTDSGIEGYFKAEAKPNSEMLSIFSTYKDNINNLNQSAVDRMERFKETNPEYYYNSIQGLIPEGSKGRIYKNWKLVEPCDFEEMPYTKFYVIDFGYSEDPTALIEMKFKGRFVYCRELIYQPGLDDLALAKRLIDVGLNEMSIIYADYGAGGDLRIVNLRRGFRNIEGYPQLANGFTIRPVIKGGIAETISIVKSYEVHYTTDSRNIDTEYQEYKWALDKNKEPTNQPIDKFNHAMDCIRYGVIMHQRM